MNIQQWVEYNGDYLAVDDQNVVCGVLRWLDDTMIIRPPTRAENRNEREVSVWMKSAYGPSSHSATQRTKIR